jgi:hypothetical protein
MNDIASTNLPPNQSLRIRRLREVIEEVLKLVDDTDFEEEGHDQSDAERRPVQ